MEEVPVLMSVAPTLTDPRMQNEKSGLRPSSQDILNELGDANNEMHRTIFNDKHDKTNEERVASEKQGMSTMLIIVFALIVIALVALIVWMVVKQNNPPTPEEVEMKARLRPHPRNAMPANMRQQMAMQQAMQPQAMPQQAMPKAMPQQAMPQPQVVSKMTVTEVTESKPVSESTQPTSTQPTSTQPTSTQPTPPNLPPALPVSPDTQDQDDDLDSIINKTNEMINDNGKLSNIDRMMLQKASSNSTDSGSDSD